MVFESIVAELVNRFGGDYLENLDSKQLNLGLFGGKVSLKNLDVKSTALDALNLPIKLKSGHLVNLHLKIPWKKLYTKPVIVHIEGLYVLILPNKGIKYDAEKEESDAQEHKHDELHRLEVARKAKRTENTEKKGGKKQHRTFAEKMAMHVLKNLQVTIGNIHVRYEDEYSNRERCFALGATLGGLSFQTTDENWMPKVIKETVKQFFKVVSLDSLAVYWNPNSKLLSHLDDSNEIQKEMSALVATKQHIPQDFAYILKPVNAMLRMKLVPNPERDEPTFSRAKVELDAVVEEIGLSIAKYQYQDILETLEGIDLMQIGVQYRKYRPDLKDYRGHYKEWWRFACDCVLNEQVRRHRQNWDWQHMQAHRTKLRNYRQAWLEKLTNKSISKSDLALIEDVENEMDVFNLNIARQEAEIAIVKRGLKRVEEQGGFFSRLFGGGKRHHKHKKGHDVDYAAKFESEITQAEKEKLYEAIDYQENSTPVDYPKESRDKKAAKPIKKRSQNGRTKSNTLSTPSQQQDIFSDEIYIAVLVIAHLQSFNLVVEDNIDAVKRDKVLSLSLKDVVAKLQQRPGVEAVRVELTMNALEVRGVPTGNETTGPHMVSMTMHESGAQRDFTSSRQMSPTGPLLFVLYEGKPTDTIDHRIRVRTHPLSVVYHALTVNKLVEIFNPPESVTLRALRTAAMARYESVREMSATGLEFALQKRTVMELDVDVQPTVVLVPTRGVYERNSDLLVLNLGALRIYTHDTASTEAFIENLSKPEVEYRNTRYDEAMKMAYDKFRVEIRHVQLLFATPQDNWHDALKQQESPLHVLKPSRFDIELQRATINDINLPKIRVLGKLPDLSFNISETRLVEIVGLVASIPLPVLASVDSDKTEGITIVEPTVRERARMRTIMEAPELDLGDMDPDTHSSDSGIEEDHQHQTTTDPLKQNAAQSMLEVTLIVQQITLNLYRQDKQGKRYQFVRVLVHTLGTDLKKRQFDLHAIAFLGNLEIQHMAHKRANRGMNQGELIDLSNTTEQALNVIENPKRDVVDHYLISLDVVNCDRKHPEFAERFQRIETVIGLKFEALHLNLHQEALVDVQKLAMKIIAEVEKAEEIKTQQVNVPALPVSRSRNSDMRIGRKSSANLSGGRKHSQSDVSRKVSSSGVKPMTTKSLDEQLVKVRVDAQLDVVKIILSRSHSKFGVLHVQGVHAEVLIRPSSQHVSATLQSIGIEDPTPGSLYPKIMSVRSDEVFQVEFTQYKRSQAERSRMEPGDVDMSVALRFSQVRFIFLNLWMNKLLNYIAPFQAAALEVTADARASTADNAVEKAQELYKQAPRVSLDISIEAPVVFVPQKSDSYEAFMADFGRLVLKNTFQTQHSKNSTVPAVIDELEIALLDVKLARVLLNKHWNVWAECSVLEPVTFGLKIVRNLSFDFFKEKPELSIVGKLPKITVGITQEDYALIMNTIYGNFAEGQPPPPAKPQKNLKSRTNPERDLSLQSSGQSYLRMNDHVVIERHVEPGSQPAPAPLNVSQPKIQAFLELEGIDAALYMGSSHLVHTWRTASSQDGVAKRDASRMLTRLQLQAVRADLQMMVDNSMSAHACLVNLIIDDARPNRPGVTRLMDKKVSKAADGHAENMFDLTFTQDSNLNQRGDVRLRAFYFCVSGEFLAALAVFFTPPKREDVPLVRPRQVAKQQRAAERRAQQAALLESTESDKPRKTTTLDLQVCVEEPEIMLVEDLSTPDETKAMILRFKLDGAVSISAAQTLGVWMELQSLQIFSSYYAQDKRDMYQISVLRPCGVTFSLKQPFGEGQNIDVRVSNITVKISPAIIALLSGVAQEITEIQKKSQQELQEEQEKHKQPRDVWETKTCEECNFWFLQNVSDIEATEDEVNDVPELEDVVEVEPNSEDLMEVRLDSCHITLEAGFKNKTVPLILLQASCSAEVRNWTSKLNASASCELEAAYYNERLDVWEPMLEPIVNGPAMTSRPWEMRLNVQQNTMLDVTDADQVLQPPQISVNLESTDDLQLTLTKACLVMLKKLGEVFGNAATKQSLFIPDERIIDADTPYAICNQSGLNVQLLSAQIAGNLLEFNGVDVPMGKKVPIDLPVIQQTEPPKPLQRRHSVVDVDKTQISVRLLDSDKTWDFNVTRAGRRYFPLPQTTFPGDTWALVVQTKVEYGCKTVMLRSILSMWNHFDTPIEIYYKPENELKLAGVVQPSNALNLPLHAIYTPNGQLYFKPAGDGYQTSQKCLDWRSFRTDIGALTAVSCASVEGGGCEFHIQVTGVQKKIAFQNSTQANGNQQVECYGIHLHPPVQFHNMLPHDIRIEQPQCQDQFGREPITLKSGDGCALTAVGPGKSFTVKMTDCYDMLWSCDITVSDKLDELTAHTFNAVRESGDPLTVDLAVHCARDFGCNIMTLFCPFWMVNKTGKLLRYAEPSGQGAEWSLAISQCCQSPHTQHEASEKDQPFEHPSDQERPVMFTVKGKRMFGKTKATLMVDDSNWSAKFPIDVVGNSGRVTCQCNDGRVYDITATMQLSSSGLTKIVTFTPFYILDNRSTRMIQLLETASVADAFSRENQWINVPAKQSIGFWPKQTADRKTAVLRYAGSADNTSEVTQPFCFTETIEILLQLPSYLGGIKVGCNVSEQSVIITLEDYVDGMAAVLLVNALPDAYIDYVQSDENDMKQLAANTCRLFNWTNVLGKRELTWSCGQKKGMRNTLFKDGIGDFVYARDRKLYWVSFLQGMQRVLLFTNDLALATNASQAYELERVQTQLTLSLQGLGFSIVNDEIGAEIAFASITSSGIIWEAKKHKRFKPLSMKQCSELEKAYHKYLEQKKRDSKTPSRKTVEKLEVDFEEWKMYKPKEKAIRRSFQTGLWVQYRMSPHENQLHAKIHKVQLDNQLTGCVFPVVFAPTPAAKSIAAEAIPKPLVEASFIMRKTEHSSVAQIKYFRVLVQEASVQADQGFITALISMFAGEGPPKVFGIDEYKKDYKLTQTSLNDVALRAISNEGKMFFDELHFSPVKVHLSFSQGGATGDPNRSANLLDLGVFNILIKSIGVTLTEIQDVTFKLAYFERNFVFMNHQQLQSAVIDHYSKQAIKQFYVLVLGLDVLGNPYGLVMNLSSGVQDFFYEPVQGAIQGPEEFAEGMALGVRSLFGHAVGGAAGAVSRITGTLGKGVAALTFDEEYQRRRQMMINRRPKDFVGGMAQGGKGLFMGVYHGVTGVVTQPIQGAKEEGAAGFAKGVGRGLIGLVARPAGGVVDFASGSFEAVKHVTDFTAHNKRVRPPRFWSSDGILQPYNLREAEGNQVLQCVNKGHYAKSDWFIAHVIISKDGRYVFVVTDKRCMVACKSRIFGTWECDWQHPYTEMRDAPRLDEGSLMIELKQPKTQCCGFMPSTSMKTIYIDHETAAKWIEQKAVEAYRSAKHY